MKRYVTTFSLQNTSDVTEAAVRAKANRVYGPRHVLFLVVDDYLAFREISDHQALHELVTERLLSS